MSDPRPFDLPDGAREGNIHLLSPPQRFEGGEEQYDAAIGGAGRDDLLRPGRGAWRLVTRHAARPPRAWLELGAGGGTCTLGLVAATPGMPALITDTSPRFLRMIAAKLASQGLAHGALHYATLAGEHLDRLAPESFDAVIIASALHHVWDWRGAIAAARRVLRPGGVLALQEPCREGNLMMGMVLDVALSPLWPAEALSGDDLERIRRCRDSIYYLADTSIVKEGEDKHSFLIDEVIAAALGAGFGQAVFYANLHFQDLAEAPEAMRRGRVSFLGYLDSFLEHHHRVSPAGMAVLRARLFPSFAGLDRVFQVGDGAPLLGCLVLRK